MWLKQSTAVTVKIGPFVDDTDGKTAETGLTISQADIRLSKNGGNIAQSNNSAGATHDELGYYDVPLDTTDTNTLGTLRVLISESGALPVWQDFMVVPANVWDSLFGADKLQVHADEITAGLITAAAIATGAIDADAVAADAVTEIQSGLATTAHVQEVEDKVDTVDSNVDAVLADTGTDGVVVAAASKSGYALSSAGIQAIWDALTSALSTANSIGKLLVDNINATISSRASQASVDTIDDLLDTEIASILAAVDTEVAAILADTNELQTDWANGGRLDLLIDAIKAKSDQLAFTTANQVDARVLTNSDKTGYSLAAGQLFVKKNVALSNFVFLMTDSTTHAPKTGVSVSGFVSIDGGSFSALANAVTEIANGLYKVNLAQAELNGTVICLRFTGTDSDDRVVTIITQA